MVPDDKSVGKKLADDAMYKLEHVGKDKNKIDKKTGPIFLVFAPKGTRYEKKTTIEDGKKKYLDSKPDVLAFDWPKPRWKFITSDKIRKVFNAKCLSFYPDILELAIQGWCLDPDTPADLKPFIGLPKSTSSTVEEAKEDSSPLKKKKRKRDKEKKPAPEPTATPKEEKEMIKRAQNIVRLNNQVKEAEAKLAEEKRLKEKAFNEELRESPPIDFEACSALGSLKNDIIVFYATKFESMEPKEKKNTDLKSTIPMAIRRHFTEEDFKPYISAKDA